MSTTDPAQKAAIARICEQFVKAAELAGEEGLQLMIQRQAELHGQDVVSAALLQQNYLSTK